MYSWYFGMYVVASGLPPLLPTVFVVSVGVASERLLKRRVVSSDPERLLVAGKVRVCCFDKTGTLTTNDMSFNGVSLSEEGVMGSHLDVIPAGSLMERMMASCHTLSLLKVEGSDATLVGTAVDKMMFGATGWTLQSGSEGSTVTNGTTTLTEVRRYEFDHARQTSSVIVRDDAGAFHIYVKGSAEAIGRVLNSSPSGFTSAANDYARSGCYTLALAARDATSAEAEALARGEVLPRESVESGLQLAGLMTFRNPLKPDSTEAVTKLREGACRVLMLTGDHALTAVHIAKEVGMVPPESRILRSKGTAQEWHWVDEDDQAVPAVEANEQAPPPPLYHTLITLSKRPVLVFFLPRADRACDAG